MKGLRSIETSVATVLLDYDAVNTIVQRVGRGRTALTLGQSAQCNTPEDFSIQQNRCEMLKPHRYHCP